MTELARIVISSIGLMTLASIVADWIERRALELDACKSYDWDGRRVAWGRSVFRGQTFDRFLVIRLPGWHWETTDYGRLEGWHRHYLTWSDRGRPAWRIISIMPRAERERALSG